MTRTPFDPRKSAAFQAAAQGTAPPLSPDQERALIEQAALTPIPSAAGNGGGQTKPISVRQVNALLAATLADHLPTTFYIQGEISNFRTYDRGHAFFTLKEPGAELPCVCWKDTLARMKFKPQDGLAVIARGSIKLYEPQGRVQLYVEEIIPKGLGSLELAFRELYEKLRNEGLFDPAHKRPLPRLPQHVAIITSRTGDVLHDVLTTAYRRFPGLHTMLLPVRVQGDQAAPDIIRAITALNHFRIQNSEFRIDLILLVRGGGSLEDLWAFNDEALARAIFASQIPIATGIGHEPDTTIADLVGDLRGPTPTGITELTIPDVRVLIRQLSAHALTLTRDFRRQLQGSTSHVLLLNTQLRAASRQSLSTQRRHVEALCEQVKRIEPRHAIAQGWRRVEESSRHLADAQSQRLRTAAGTLAILERRLERVAPLTAIGRARDRLDHLAAKLQRATHTHLATAAHRLAALGDQLTAVSPQAVLNRGYSITTNAEGTIIRSKTQVAKGDPITTRVADGQINSVVGQPKQGSLF